MLLFGANQGEQQQPKETRIRLEVVVHPKSERTTTTSGKMANQVRSSSPAVLQWTTTTNKNKIRS
jgi:hypothetical protein